jgi:hypothetical protein
MQIENEVVVVMEMMTYLDERQCTNNVGEIVWPIGDPCRSI